ncbi:YjcQ family protein [Lacticaseibacillus yichunensis]|uniref:YjcQ family protein n=1 Tax=Lacticaseibacillus yichunensis TaxID=2486015 RepID=A0ABW4CLJ6_9LACO|nr:YjcQ family protein [Lacticaseibacillus yichunensis]
MAKDDYFVIVYQLLKLLYENLKQGKQITSQEFNDLCINLNQSYWDFIVLNMSRDGYISGVVEIKTLTGIAPKIQDVMITPKGIEYLFSNSMMERVKNTLKDLKSIVPGM